MLLAIHMPPVKVGLILFNGTLGSGALPVVYHCGVATKQAIISRSFITGFLFQNAWEVQHVLTEINIIGAY